MVRRDEGRAAREAVERLLVAARRVEDAFDLVDLDVERCEEVDFDRDDDPRRVLDRLLLDLLPDLLFFAEADPAGGDPNFTPERRAFDNPMAIACLRDFTPCFPCFT